MLFVASLVFCYPLVYSFGNATSQAGDVRGFHNLLFDSHEKLHYVIRLSELDSALTAGQWMPRWSPNLAAGYGYPFFNFYAPLSYYTANLWHQLGFDLFLAWKLHFLLMACLSGAGAFYFARLFYATLPALAAGLLYLLAPYHIVNLYVRGNVAEFMAMTVLPFVFYCVVRLLRSPSSVGNAWGVAVMMAAMVLTHNITAMLTAAVLAVWLGVLMVRRPYNAVVAAAALGVGIAFSCFFWLPALLELKHTRAAALAATFSSTHTHVVYWAQYFSNQWGFGLSEAGPRDQMPFGLGWVHWLAVIGTIVAAIWKRERLTWVWPTATLLILLLASNWCRVIWTLPGLVTVQFPWRLMLFAALFASVAGASLIHSVGRFGRYYTIASFTMLVVLLGSVSLPKIKVTSYFPNSAAMYQPAATRQRFITTNNEEFLMRWVDQQAISEPSRRRILTSEGETVRTIPATEFLRPQFTYRSASAETLIYEAFYFPGWQAYADDQAVATGPSPTGLIQFLTVAGEARYQLRFGFSPIRRIATFVSLGSLLIALSTTLLVLRSRRRNASVTVHAPTPAA